MVRHYEGWMTEPGRVPNQDSIDASSEDPGGSEEGYQYTGYDTPAATRIGKEGVDDQRDIERLRELNEERDSWSNKQYSLRGADQDKIRFSQALCQSLPLAKKEREKVVAVVEQLDFERFGYQKEIQRVVLGTVAVVMDEFIRPPETFEEAITRCEPFQSTKSALGVSMSDLGTIKDRVREMIKNGDVTIPEPAPENHRRDPALPAPTSYSEKPEEYWENYSPERWAIIARGWEHHREEMEDALPDEKRELVQKLRKWEPWKIQDEDITEDSSIDIAKAYEEMRQRRHGCSKK